MRCSINILIFAAVIFCSSCTTPNVRETEVISVCAVDASGMRDFSASYISATVIAGKIILNPLARPFKSEYAGRVEINNLAGEKPVTNLVYDVYVNRTEGGERCSELRFAIVPIEGDTMPQRYFRVVPTFACITVPRAKVFNNWFGRIFGWDKMDVIVRLKVISPNTKSVTGQVVCVFEMTIYDVRPGQYVLFPNRFTVENTSNIFGLSKFDVIIVEAHITERCKLFRLLSLGAE